jgi:hypothetical protein
MGSELKKLLLEVMDIFMFKRKKREKRGKREKKEGRRRKQGRTGGRGATPGHIFGPKEPWVHVL